MNQAWSLTLGVAAAASLACVTGCQPPAVDGQEANNNRQVSVQVVRPRRTTLPRTTTQPATVHAYFETRVFAKTAGYLAELKVDIGDAVETGDILAVIAVPEMDKQREVKRAKARAMAAEQRRAAALLAVAQARMASFEGKLAQAKAEVEKASADLTAASAGLQRMTDLVQHKAVADRLLDEARKTYDAATAQKAAAQASVQSAAADIRLATAQRNAAQADVEVAQAATDVTRRELDEWDELLKYARLTAPFDGMVTQRHVDPGDLVRNAQAGSRQGDWPLFVIAQLDPVRVRVPVPERDAPLASVGDVAALTFSALPGKTLPGKITRVSGVLDEETRTMLVEIDLPNPDGLLLPGMFGEATITLTPPSGRVTLPAEAVRHDKEGNSYVYVINTANQVAVANVQTGLDDGKQIEIIDGLTGQERVATATIGRLQPGERVDVRN